MKHTFVLDENVFVSANTGQNAHNRVDYSSSLLVLQIGRNCHRIAWNAELRRRYGRLNDRLSRRREYDPFMKASRLIFHFMANQGKNLHNESCLKLDPDLENDSHIVSLAVFTEGILVTEDTRLKRELQRKNLAARHRLRIVEPKEALQFADET